MKRAAEGSADEAETIVAEEWRRHGLEAPTGVVMERWADQIADPPSLEEQTANNARIVKDLLGLPLRLRRAAKGGLGQLFERMDEDRGRVYEIATGSEMIAATTTPGATSHLDRLATRAVGLPSVLRMLKLELTAGDHGGIELRPYEPNSSAQVPRPPIGVIAPSQASPFLRPMMIASRVNQPCVCGGGLLRTRDHAWQLIVKRPLT